MITNELMLQISDYMSNTKITKWVNQEVFSPTWFGVVSVIIICYALFFYFVDKKRITEILLFGSLVSVAFVCYDTIGFDHGYWEQLVSVTPYYPFFFGDNITTFPLIAMLIYQYTSSWRSFAVWYEIWTGLFIFVFHFLVLVNLDAFIYRKPFAVLIDFVLLSIVGIIARGLMVYMLGMEAKQGNIASKHFLSHLIAQPAMKSNIEQEENNNGGSN